MAGFSIILVTLWFGVVLLSTVGALVLLAITLLVLGCRFCFRWGLPHVLSQ